VINKMTTVSLSTVFTSILFLFFLSHAPVDAAACKGLSKSKCAAKSACSWVSGYTTKKGAKVSAFCRNKPGSGSTKAKKKSNSAKSSKDKKKSPINTPKEDNKTKTKSKTKKEKKAKQE